MSNRPIIETSQEAYKALQPEMLRSIYVKILIALKRLGSANTEKIAEYMGVDHAKVHRRVSEMEKLEMIWRPGGKVLTKAGRKSFLWTVRGDKQAKTDEQAKAENKKPTEPKVSTVNVLRQANLFQ